MSFGVSAWVQDKNHAHHAILKDRYWGKLRRKILPILVKRCLKSSLKRRAERSLRIKMAGGNMPTFKNFQKRFCMVLDVMMPTMRACVSCSPMFYIRCSRQIRWWFRCQYRGHHNDLKSISFRFDRNTHQYRCGVAQGRVYCTQGLKHK